MQNKFSSECRLRAWREIAMTGNAAGRGTRTGDAGGKEMVGCKKQNCKRNSTPREGAFLDW